jgi:hypothetical protein
MINFYYNYPYSLEYGEDGYMHIASQNYLSLYWTSEGLSTYDPNVPD